MQLKKGQIVEIEIDALAFGGAGIGRYFESHQEDRGLAVFVKDTMPGDLVKASFTKIKKTYAEAKLVEIARPSAERIEPKCRYFEQCGGCQLQFMPYEKQLELKKQQVIDAFERIGGFENPPVMEILASEKEFYYRNKMEFSFGYDAEMNFALGLHLPGRRYDILDLEECHLQSEFSFRLVNLVRDFFGKKFKKFGSNDENKKSEVSLKAEVSKNSWNPYQFSCGLGFLRSLYIREGKNTGEVMINLETSEQEPEDLEEVLKNFVEELVKFNEEFGERFGGSLEGGFENSKENYETEKPKKIVSIYWTKITSKRGQRKKIESNLLYGKESFLEILDLEKQKGVSTSQMRFEVLPQAFFQVNTEQAEVLYSRVLDFASESRGKSADKKSKDEKLRDGGVIFDLFCGTGTIGLFLAKKLPNSQVIGIELNEDAIKIAKKNAELNEIKNIEFYNGDVGKILEEINISENSDLIENLESKKIEESKFSKPDLIVIDPPRAGLTPKMIELIKDFKTERLVYVSCNPATLARDCKNFQESGYKIQKIQPVDMFPQTFHIETVCLLEKS